MFGLNLHLFLFINIVNLFSSAYCEIPRVLLCADPMCNEPISEAQGKILYIPNEKNGLGFKKGAKMVIYSKSKDRNGHWGAKIGDKFGFVPSDLVKEVSVWKSYDMLKYEVPNNIVNDNTFVQLKEKQNVGPDTASTNTVVASESKSESPPQQGSDKIPLSNLIHGDIHGLSHEHPTHQGSNVEMKTGNMEPNVVKINIATVTSPVNQESEVAESVKEGGKNEYENVENRRNEMDEGTAGQKNSNNAINISDKMNENIVKYSESLEPVILNTENQSSVLNSSDNVENNINVNEQNLDLMDSARESEENILIQGNSHGSHESLKGNIGTVNVSNSNENENKMVIGSSNYDAVNETDSGTEGINYKNITFNDETQSALASDDSHRTDPKKNELHSDGSSEIKTTETHLGSNAVPEVVEKVDKSTLSEPANNIIQNLEPSESEEAGVKLPENILVEEHKGSEDKKLYSNLESNAGKMTNEINDKDTEKQEMNVRINEDLGHIQITTVIEEPAVSSSIVSSGSSSSSSSSSDSASHEGRTNTDTGSRGFTENTVLSTEEHQPGSHYIPSNLNGWGLHFGANAKVEVKQDEPKVVSGSEFSHSSKGSLPDETVSKNTEQSYVMEGTSGSLPTEMKDLPPPVIINRQGESTLFANSMEKPSVQNADDGKNVLPSDHGASVVIMDGRSEKSEESISEHSEPLTPVNENAASDDTNLIDRTENAEESGFISKISEKVLYWVGLGSKKPEEGRDNLQSEISETVALKNPSSAGMHFQESGSGLDGTCKTEGGVKFNGDEGPCDESNNMAWSFWTGSHTKSITSSYNTFIYLVVTAVTVLLFTLGYYFIEKFRSDGPLIAKVNRLEQELLVSSKECLLLKDELVNTKEKLNLFETSSNDKIITALQQELDESKKLRSELENNVELLQQELDAATEAGLDLNRMLSEVLTQKGGSETLMESVEHLQAQLNNQQKIIDEMTSKLINKTKENQELQDELTVATERIETLEGEIEDMRGNINVHLKDNEDVISDLTTKNSELQVKINQLNDMRDKESSKMKKNIGELEKKLKAAVDSLKIKEEECNNLKDSVKKIKLKDSKSFDSLFDVSRVKAELSQSESENKSLKEKIKLEEEKQKKLESKVGQMEEEIQRLKQVSCDAEKEKAEAQTRLEVLSNYFKEKETQLQKELGLREAMLVQKQGDDSTVYERMKSLEEEVNSYKSQNEALKKEILDQERGLKAQITTLEKKAHENWIAARQAERKLEESKQEAGQLRNKLTLMEKNISNDIESSQHHRVNEELNGGDVLSPLIHDTSSPILFPPPLPLDPNNSSLIPPGFIPPPVFMPPPPGGFMPPPPPFLPGDHRPPPLGRMSSPPLNNRFSPPPPDYAYDRMSTPPLSPSSRNYRSPNELERDRERFRHRTPTSPSFRSRNWEEGPSIGMSGFRPISSERDTRREHKGSNLSSGHSSDSLDKSSRHSSRV